MKMIINGKAVNSSDNTTLDVINPANGALVDTIPSATQEDVAAAIAAAKAGQKIWAKVPVWEKAEIMMKFLTLVERDKEELAQTLSQETGKPIIEARGEIANIPIAFKAFSTVKDTALVPPKIYALVARRRKISALVDSVRRSL